MQRIAGSARFFQQKRQIYKQFRETRKEGNERDDCLVR